MAQVGEGTVQIVRAASGGDGGRPRREGMDRRGREVEVVRGTKTVVGMPERGVGGLG